MEFVVEFVEFDEEKITAALIITTRQMHANATIGFATKEEISSQILF
jgi:hypothetical protein